MDQHIYHHDANAGPTITVKAEKNTKGFNYEAAVSGAATVEQAMTLLNQAIDALESRYGAPEPK